MIYGPDGQPVLRSIEPGEFELAGHLIAAELAAGPPVQLVIERQHAFCLVGALQLALRHPGFSGAAADITRQIAEHVADGVAGESQVLRDAFAMGWDRQCDEMGKPDEDLSLSEYRPGDLGEYSEIPTSEVPEACPVCGCTEETACADDGTGNPCRWVAVVVCSTCAVNCFPVTGEVTS